MTIKSNCTDAELSAAVAEHVAGWSRVEIDERGKVFGIRCQIDSFPSLVPPYATSADAVLGLLEKLKTDGWWVETKDHTNGLECNERDWLVILTNYNPSDDAFMPEARSRYIEGVSQALPRAICFALLKAAGVTVEEVSL